MEEEIQLCGAKASGGYNFPDHPAVRQIHGEGSSAWVCNLPEHVLQIKKAVGFMEDEDGEARAERARELAAEMQAERAYGPVDMSDLDEGPY